MTVINLSGNSYLKEKVLENWLWKITSHLRGLIDPSKYKEYILPLIFLKRLSDVFYEEIENLSSKHNEPFDFILKRIDTDEKYRKVYLKTFYVPPVARWNVIKKTAIDNVGEYLTNAVRELVNYNPDLDGVVNIVDYNATYAGERILNDVTLKNIVNELDKYKT